MKKIFLFLLTTIFLFSGSAFAEPGKAGIKKGTGSAALSLTYTPVDEVYLVGIRVHLSAAATQDTLYVSINSNTSSVYDVVLLSQAMSGYQDLSWVPAGRLMVKKDDVITITWANNDTRTWGAEIVYEY
jgi:hypothetical protein